MRERSCHRFRRIRAECVDVETSDTTDAPENTQVTRFGIRDAISRLLSVVTVARIWRIFAGLDTFAQHPQARRFIICTVFMIFSDNRPARNSALAPTFETYQQYFVVVARRWIHSGHGTVSWSAVSCCTRPLLWYGTMHTVSSLWR